jgi:hypothetical protein
MKSKGGEKRTKQDRLLFCSFQIHRNCIIKKINRKYDNFMLEHSFIYLHSINNEKKSAKKKKRNDTTLTIKKIESSSTQLMI